MYVLKNFLTPVALISVLMLSLGIPIVWGSGQTITINYPFTSTVQSKTCFLSYTGQPATLKQTCQFNYSGKLSGYLIAIYDDKEINGIHCWIFSTGFLQLNNVRESILYIGMSGRACDNTPVPVTYGVAFDGGTNIFNYSSGSGTMTFNSTPFASVGSIFSGYVKGSITLAA